MDRSPYGEFATELLAWAGTFLGLAGVRQGMNCLCCLPFSASGCVAIVLDMRGTKKSGGSFTMWKAVRCAVDFA